MNATNFNTHNVATPYCSCNSVLSKFVLITGVALAVIGILAALQIYGFYPLFNYWYLFEIAALACFVFGVVCCCKVYYSSKDQVSYPPHQVRYPMAQHPTNVQNNNGLMQTQQTTTINPLLTPAEKLMVEGRVAFHATNYAKAVHAFNASWGTYRYAPAGLALAECYHKGLGVQQNNEFARQLYYEFAKTNYMEGVYYLANDAFAHGDAPKALEWLEHACRVDYDEERKKKLIDALKQTDPSTQPNVDPQSFTLPETQAAAQQLQARNLRMMEDTRNTYLKALAATFYHEEISRRNDEDNKLAAPR